MRYGDIIKVRELTNIVRNIMGTLLMIMLFTGCIKILNRVERLGSKTDKVTTSECSSTYIPLGNVTATFCESDPQPVWFADNVTKYKLPVLVVQAIAIELISNVTQPVLSYYAVKITESEVNIGSLVISLPKNSYLRLGMIKKFMRIGRV